MCQAYIRIKLLTGMARSDLLRINPSTDFSDVGIHITRHKTQDKTGKSTIYEWSPELRAAIAKAEAVKPVANAPFLFCTRKGTGYIEEEKGTASSWDSVWQRYMERVMAETKVDERFTEHDLRAKCASDAESLEHARALLSHIDSRITDRIYRRKPELVKAAKVTFE